jgi:ABC-type dipeptide/oligopeptide/nickel transport system ATPase component
VVLRIADRILVLDGGRIVEEGSGGRLLVSPQHHVTRALLAASGRDLLFSGNGTGGSHSRSELDDLELLPQGGHRS